MQPFLDTTESGNVSRAPLCNQSRLIRIVVPIPFPELPDIPGVELDQVKHAEPSPSHSPGIETIGRSLSLLERAALPCHCHEDRSDPQHQ